MQRFLDWYNQTSPLAGERCKYLEIVENGVN